MARFRGTVRADGVDASRLGHVNSGLVTNCNGWDAGVEVIASAQGEIDCFNVWITGGSHNDAHKHLAGVLRCFKSGKREWTPTEVEF